MILRPICWITNHDWKIIKRNDFVLIRECKFCGKLEKIYLK